MVFHNWDKPVQVVVFLFTFLLIRIIMAKHRALQTRILFFLNRNSKSIFWDFCCFVFAKKKKCIFRHFNTKMKWGFRPVSALEPDNLHILFFFKPLIYTLISWKICQNISIVSKTPPPPPPPKVTWLTASVDGELLLKKGLLVLDKLFLI